MRPSAHNFGVIKKALEHTQTNISLGSNRSLARTRIAIATGTDQYAVLVLPRLTSQCCEVSQTRFMVPAQRVNRSWRDMMICWCLRRFFHPYLDLHPIICVYFVQHLTQNADLGKWIYRR